MTYGEAALTKKEPFRIFSYVVGVVGGRDFEVLTPGERIFALSSQLIGEVCNGGFDQYFFNGGVVYAHETAKALATIRAVQTEQLLRQAIRIARVPERLAPDYDYYDQATEEIQKRLNTLDHHFYGGELDVLEVYPRLVEYLREHTVEFS